MRSVKRCVSCRIPETWPYVRSLTYLNAAYVFLFSSHLLRESWLLFLEWRISNVLLTVAVCWWYEDRCNAADCTQIGDEALGQGCQLGKAVHADTMT